MNYYSGIKKKYFHKLLKTLVEVGDLNNNSILDFGCGQQELKKFLNHGNYVGFDVIKEFSDTDDPAKANYDVMVVNEVFYEMTEENVRKTLETIRPRKLVVGISRQSWLNKLGSLILAPDALIKTLISPKKEMEILRDYYQIKKHKSVFGLADVYLMELKK